MNTPVLALAGGVGGAKLALGLSKVLTPEELTIVVNTGDDEEFFGLHIAPDLDTVMYTLAGLANPKTGWGLAGDTFQTLERLKAYDVQTWFSLGDKDMATHIRRTELLRQGSTLSQVTAVLHTKLGINHPIVPMSDDRVRTIVTTSNGEIAFQEYFVKHQARPVVRALRFDGAEVAHPSPNFMEALRRPGLLVICPSNPFLSVAPILSVQNVRKHIEGFPGLRVAISPIVGGKALRGPAAKLLAELNQDVSCVGVAKQYQGICDVFVLDHADEGHVEDIAKLGMSPYVTRTIMNTDADKIELAQEICQLSGK